MIKNRIPIEFSGQTRIIAPEISYKYDMVQFLVISGLNLPDYYETDFCNEGDSQTITITGTAEGVQIPDNLLLTGKPVKAYIVLTGDDEGAVETRYEITLPVHGRPARSDIQPTPEERLEIDALVDALNDGIQRVEDTEAEAEADALKSEGYAVGTQDGQDVPPGSPYFMNNSKFYSEVAGQATSESGWVYFYIDEDGDLHYVKTANSDLDFYIDDNGNLHVTNAA